MYKRDTLYRGRKMTPGKYVANPSTGRMGIFLCYCPNSDCRVKIIVDRSYMRQLTRHNNYEQKRVRYRILTHFLKKYALDADPNLHGVYGAEEYRQTPDTVDSI